MIKNKRGIWRIVEAVIAVFILASAIVMLFLQDTREESENLLFDDILNEIAKDKALREKVINDDSNSVDAENEIMNILEKRILNQRLEYNVSICRVSDSCASENFYPADIAEVYSQERIVSSTLDRFEPKIVKIYVWARE